MSPTTTADTTDAQTEISVDDTNVYDGVKITDLKKDIVEYLAHNPNATNKEVSEAVGCSISYPSPVRDDFGDLILQRAQEVGSDVNELEESIERRQKKRASEWGDLTTKQREVLRRLAEEDDPENPSSSLRSIIEDLDFDTHPAYVSDVKTKYVDYAHKLKKAHDMADENQDPEALIDEVELDEPETEEAPEESEEEPDTEPEAEPEPVAVSEDEQSALESLYAEIESQKKMAKSEMEYTDSQLAAGRLVMAEQIESKLNEIMNGQ